MILNGEVLTMLTKALSKVVLSSLLLICLTAPLSMLRISISASAALPTRRTGVALAPRARVRVRAVR